MDIGRSSNLAESLWPILDLPEALTRSGCASAQLSNMCELGDPTFSSSAGGMCPLRRKFPEVLSTYSDNRQFY